MGLSVDFTDDGSVEIVAPTPEGAIRLATACSGRAILCVDYPKRDVALDPAALVVLVPTDEAPTSLCGELHSRSGPLADWLRIPPLPIEPILDDKVRAAIASWITESSSPDLRRKK